MKRQSNIELLRIFSMFLIVVHHYANHGGSYWCATTKLNVLVSTVLAIGGTLGVNLFVIITGYFLVNSDFKWSRIIKIEIASLFYSILFFCIACFVWKTETVNFISLRNTLLPTLTNLGTQYWFVPCYFALVLASPFLNVMINNISREQYKRLIFVLLLLGCVIPTVMQTPPLFDGNIMVFIIMYLLGGYIRKYEVTFKPDKNYLPGLLAAVIYGMLALFTFVFKLNAAKLAEFGLNADVLWGRYSIFIIGLAVIIFVFFKQMTIKDSKIINVISSTTIGIYLIHDNVYVRSYMWSNILHANEYYDSPKLILHAFVCVIVVFVVCSFVEFVRSRAFDWVFKGCEKVLKK